MGRVSVKTTTVTVTGTASEVLAANVDRKFLSLHNKSECNVLIKYGGNFGGANNEIQKITFTPAATPSGGSFKLKYGANKTAAITYDAAADSDIQTALRALAGCSGVVVSGDFANGFTVEYAGAEANTNATLLEVTDNTLVTDDFQAVEVQTIQFSAVPTAGAFKLGYGAGETSELTFESDAAAVQAALRALTGLEAVTVAALVGGDGFVVTFAGTHADKAMITVTENSLIDETTETDEVQEIYVNMEPTEGTFKLMHKGQTTGALAYNATAEAIQTALRALSTIGADATVSGSCFQKVKQVMTYTVNVLEDQPYMISTATHDYTYTPPSGAPADETTVVAAIMALINANAAETFVASLGGTAPHQTLVLTAKVAGEAFDSEPTANMTEATTTANNRGMTVTFTGAADGAENQPMLVPVDVNLIRYGEQLRMDVYANTQGVAAANVTATVTETTKGVDDQSMVGTVTTLTQGLAYANEGTPLAPGAKITASEAVPIDSVWAECDEDSALLEIQEG